MATNKTTLVNELQGALDRFNRNLEPSGRCVQIQARNGYIALDMYSIKTGKCIDFYTSTDTNKQMLNLLYALSKAIELVNNPI